MSPLSYHIKFKVYFVRFYDKFVFTVKVFCKVIGTIFFIFFLSFFYFGLQVQGQLNAIFAFKRVFFTNVQKGKYHSIHQNNFFGTPSSRCFFACNLKKILILGGVHAKIREINFQS